MATKCSDSCRLSEKTPKKKQRKWDCLDSTRIICLPVSMQAGFLVFMALTVHAAEKIEVRQNNVL